MIYTALILIIVLSLLVFVHELGHFLTAKRAGIRVDEFGFGFPPRAYSVKRGGTVYSINWIPLGGFVKIKGESGEHASDKDSFASKPLHVRALVLSAGVIMNIVLCWVLLSVGYLIGLPQIVDEGLSPYARITDSKIQVSTVLEGSPAERAGIKSGDTILKVSGVPVTDAQQVRDAALISPGDVFMSVARDGKNIDFAITPERLAIIGKPGIGVALAKTGLVSYPAHIAPLEGAHATWVLTSDILSAFGGLIRDLFVDRKVSVELSGPVGIAFITADVAKLGFRYILQFTALLSINLAIINIFPIPALDGGRLAFLLVEAVRRKPLGRNIETITHNVGFALLMTLVVVITFRDVVKFGDRILQGLGSLFGA